MKRRTARQIAVQSLYHMEMNDVSEKTAIQTVIEEGNDDDPQTIMKTNASQNDFILKLVEGVWIHKHAIDDILIEYLKGWQMDRLSRVDRQILRLAAFEMIYSKESPPKVIVNEAIDLSKFFGTDESGKFVNGVLGQIIKKVNEIRAHVNN